ncbi:MAG: hypothetical protein HY292_14200 [Planctomycetes bacterium]|nr:hypothetical protein [Planctomycetota bacterium]
MEPGALESLDGYIFRETNPTHLGSSLEHMVRLPNFFALFDTNVLCGTSSYLSTAQPDQIEPLLIHNLNVFYRQLVRIVDEIPHVLLIEPVVAEMSNVLRASQSVAERKIRELQSLPAMKRDALAHVRATLQDQVHLSTAMHEAIQRRSYRPELLDATCFEGLLELVKLFDETLELKKTADPTKRNDTDERLAATAFYELLMHDRNIAVYSRDDDVRKLVATVYRFAVAPELVHGEAQKILQKLRFHKIIVFKFHAGKRTFSRFFESDTARHTDVFYFPTKITAAKQREFISEANRLLTVMARRMFEVLRVSEPVPTPITADESRAALKEAVDYLRPMAEFLNNVRLWDNLSLVSRFLEHEGLTEQIHEVSRSLRRSAVGTRITTLRELSEKNRVEVKTLTQGDLSDPARLMRLGELSRTLLDTESELRFFEEAQKRGRDVSPNDYVRIQPIVRGLGQRGYALTERVEYVSVEDIAEATGVRPTTVITTINENALRTEGSKVLLHPVDLLLFLKDER